MSTKILRLCLVLLSAGFSAKAVDRHVYVGNSIQTQVNASASGDRVIIHAGTYSQSISISGKTGVTITNAGDGEVIVQGNGSDWTTVYISNSSSIVVSNLTIKNTRKLVWSTGITITGSGSGVQILNNKVTDVSYRSGAYDATDNPNNNGAQFQGVNAITVIGDNASTAYSNIVIKDNEVSYCMTGWSEAIAVKGNVNGFNVENNKVHHITNIGIDAFGLGTFPSIATNNQARNGTIKNNEVYECKCNYTDNGAVYVDGGLNIAVMNNKIYNNIYGITIGCENQMNKADGATEFIEVRNNLVYNNTKAGIMVGTGGDDDGLQGITRYCKVTGNTFVKNATGDQWAGELMIQNAHHIEFYNNIFYGSGARIGTVNLGTYSNTFGNNIFYGGSGVTVDFSKQTGTSTWISQTLAQFKTDMSDVTSTQTNPLLVNATISTLNAHLQASSPAINAGKSGFMTIPNEKDLDGHGRIYGSAIDIGVDESGSSSSVAVTGISVSPASASIAPSATQALTATIAPGNATNQTKFWSSNNTAVATVNASGIVTGVAGGTAVITVTTQDGSFTASSTITVTGGTTIVVNGNLSDWSSISAIATASSQTSTSLKVHANASTLYFGVAGSGMSATDYQIFINSDNNTATGYQDGAYTSSGADYMIENGNFYRSTGTGWSWTGATATLTVSKNSGVTELSINRSAFTSLAATIRVAYKDMVNWTTVSKLPSSGAFAAYTLSSPPPPLQSADRMLITEHVSAKTTVYPNPVTGNSFEVKYQVPVTSDVRYLILDASGREVYTQHIGSREPGTYSQSVDVATVPQGLYLVKMTVGNQVQTVRIARH